MEKQQLQIQDVIVNMVNPVSVFEGMILATACFHALTEQRKLHDEVLEHFQQTNQNFYFYVQN